MLLNKQAVGCLRSGSTSAVAAPPHSCPHAFCFDSGFFQQWQHKTETSILLAANTPRSSALASLGQQNNSVLRLYNLNSPPPKKKKGSYRQYLGRPQHALCTLLDHFHDTFLDSCT